MNLSFFLFYCLLMTITPGPNNIMILSTVHNHGIQKALQFCYGSTVAFGMILTLSALLNSMLAKILPSIIFVMQWIGSIYILYLAYQVARMDNEFTSKNAFGSFKAGFFVQVVNPKGILFCITIFPSFIMPYYTSYDTLMFFVCIITAIGAFSFFSWIVFGNLITRFLHHYKKSINFIMALFLLYTAIIISGILDYIE